VAPEVDVYGKGSMRPATTNEYDKGGNIRFTHDANGKTVQMQYDAIGRLTNILWMRSPTPSRSRTMKTATSVS
jgi:YD repeat-containing protein